MDNSAQQSVAFERIIAALLDSEHPFPAVHWHRFSDISAIDLHNLEKIWQDIQPDRRVALLEDLETLAESDTLVSFDDLSKFALSDPDPRAREVALRLLWESEDSSLIQKMIEIVDHDSAEKVRAAAATALGQFVYLGELEEIPESSLHRIEEKLLSITTSTSEPKLVRRRALEALGFSSRPELKQLIMAAYNNNDREWLVSAIFAMGRSANSNWIPSVMEMIDADDEDVLLEAVRAAGELEAPGARRPLLKIIKSQPEGSEIRMAAIWSLSKIGGEKVRDTFEKLMEESEDEEELDILDEALENLEFTEGFNKFGMIDYDPESEEAVLANPEADRWVENTEDEDDDYDESDGESDGDVEDDERSDS
jgi:hypothetical protein